MPPLVTTHIDSLLFTKLPVSTEFFTSVGGSVREGEVWNDAVTFESTGAGKCNKFDQFASKSKLSN